MLIVHDLHKKFGTRYAVKGLSFSVETGEAFGLLGPNGAGKSTTIHMISGLFPPSAGAISIFGIDMVKHPKRGQRRLGVVPQEIALYPAMSAKENLAFWGRMYGLYGSTLRKRTEEVLEIIGLSDRAKDRVETFSGGMKRRVNIGAALMHRPELIIMDEPTVGIDPQSRHHILETVKRLNAEGATVIYTSHYMEEVESVCQRIGIMDDGQMIAYGTLKELRETIGDRSRIVLSLRETPERSDRLIASLRPWFDGKDVQVKDGQVTVFHQEPERILGDLIHAVTGCGAKVTAINIVEPNLESVFLHLTGKALRD